MTTPNTGDFRIWAYDIDIQCPECLNSIDLGNRLTIRDIIAAASAHAATHAMSETPARTAG